MLVEIGGIVDEGQRPGDVDEAELRDEAHGAADGGGEGVKRGVGGGEGAVYAIGKVPVGGLVIAAFPGDAVFPAEFGIGFLDAPPLHAAELFDIYAVDGSLGKAVEEHAPCDLIARFLVSPGAGVDACHGVVMVRRDAEGVEAQAVLAEPEQRAVALGGGFDGGVGDRGAGAEDERGDGGDGQAGDEAVGSDPFDGGIVHLDAAVFQVDGRPAVLGGREGIEGRAFEDGHGEREGRLGDTKRRRQIKRDHAR